MMKIVLATGNADKVREIRNILKGCPVELVPLSEFPPLEVVEDRDTFFGNARKKAYEVSVHTGLPALADDSGLVVEALGGAPGIYSSRYAGAKASYEDNVRKLLFKMRLERHREAAFVCVSVLYFPGGEIFTSRGKLEGRISKEVSGGGGFGYDPVFYIAKKRKTLAELADDEKNAISHRGEAFRKMARVIKKLALRDSLSSPESSSDATDNSGQ
ncbi:MAG: RdgB/HAM1 family non-canonical purine NTP pyrophosphatase [Candidatus Omnitrophota bacterium]|nr:RdgB/HAM1 family non-canonical purine NTP pyrophosphatase [Candidatus Omnitrophota bacterium]MBU2528454.1 RdgB/HAM1 family non-canonical purine NTP pyrophosphatase [bacterium]MBU3929814.1 RdgB/HAM1 family non-canonical purine NTP pyrophosphatase [bacterium]MBU4122613.1 RdgB/HAM1 family non-canonical purine NTP pyrophosphatase [bacterium]